MCRWGLRFSELPKRCTNVIAPASTAPQCTTPATLRSHPRTSSKNTRNTAWSSAGSRATVLARERHQPVETAARTPGAHEPAREHSTPKKHLELRDDVPQQRVPTLLHALGEGGEVIAHEAMQHAIADGIAGAHVSRYTAIGHRWVRGQSDRRAAANPL